MDAKTAKAFDNLRIAAAKYMGWDPEQTNMTICRPFLHDETNDPDDTDTASDINTPPPTEEFFYAQHAF